MSDFFFLLFLDPPPLTRRSHTRSRATKLLRLLKALRPFKKRHAPVYLPRLPSQPPPCASRVSAQSKKGAGRRVRGANQIVFTPREKLLSAQDFSSCSGSTPTFPPGRKRNSYVNCGAVIRFPRTSTSRRLVCGTWGWSGLPAGAKAAQAQKCAGRRCSHQSGGQILQGTNNPEKPACPEIPPSQAHSSHETRKIAHMQYDRNKYT